MQRPRRPARARSRAPRKAAPAAPAAIAAFLADLGHPLSAELQALRRIVARAAPELVEGVKWNAPSYRRAGGDDVLTFNLSAKDRVRLIFHRGAKRDAHGKGRMLTDDGGLLQWAADDRAIATFRSMADVRAGKATLAKLVRSWLAATAGTAG